MGRRERTSSRDDKPPAARSQVLGFTPRDFAVFGLPYRSPGTPVYVRRNGALTSTVTGGELGAPYGQDRLLVIWLATVFKMCGSPESIAIAFGSRATWRARSGRCPRGSSASGFRPGSCASSMRRSWPRKPGRTRFGASATSSCAGCCCGRTASRGSRTSTRGAPNVVVLDPVFAADIRAGAVPTDFQAVLALGENMGALSLYLFEAYASYRHACRGKADRYVPVLGPGGLLAQIGCGVNEGNTRKARATIRHWHGLVKQLWPDCPNELVRGDTALVVRGGFAIARGDLPEAGMFGVCELGGQRSSALSPLRPAQSSASLHPRGAWP